MYRNRWFVLAAAALALNGLGIWQGLRLYERSLQAPDPDETLTEADLKDYTPSLFPEPGSVLAADDPLIWRWRQAVVDKAMVGEIPTPPPASLTPEHPGAFAWIDDRTLQFTPEKAWPACQEFQIELDSIFENPDGKAWQSRHSTMVQGPPLQWLGTELMSRDNDRELLVALTFNQAVEPEELRRHLRVTDGRGRNLSFSVRQTPAFGNLLVSAENSGRSPFTLTLQPGLSSRLGPQGAIPEGIARRVAPTPTFALTSIEAEIPTFGPGWLELGFTSSPELRRVRDHIEIEPPVEFSVSQTQWWRRNHLRLTGDFEPGRRYTVRLLPSMSGTNGQALEQGSQRIIFFPARRPGLRFKHEGDLLNAAGSRQIDIEQENEGKITLELHRLHDNNLVAFLVRDSGIDGWQSQSSPDSGLSAPLWREEMPTPSEGALRIDLAESLAKAGQGIYRLQAKGEKSGQTIHRLLLVSDLGLLARRHRDQLLVWAVGLADGQPRVNVEVDLWSASRQSMARGTTDQRGMLTMTVPDSDAEAFALIARQGESLGVLALRNPRNLPAANPGRPYLEQGYEAFLYTDRGIYRPGEPVHLRGAVRGSGWSLPGQFPVQLALRAPDRIVVWQELQTLSDLGTAAASIRLEDNWPNGRYTLTMSMPGEDGVQLGQTAINLESFVPPQILVEADTPGHPQIVPADFSVRVRARMLYGGAAPAHPVEATLSLTPEKFRSPDYPDHVFSDPRIDSFGQWSRKLGEGRTDEAGEIVFPVALPPEMVSPSALRAIARLTVTEFSGRPATAFVSRRLDLVPHYLGLEVTPLNSTEVRLDIVALTPDNQPLAGNRTVDIDWFSASWSRGYRRDDEGRFTYVSEQVDHPEGSRQVELVDGRASLTLGLGAPGHWRIAVADQAGAPASTIVQLGRVATPPARADRVEMALDREQYHGGDRALLTLHPPFAGQALITVETDELWWSDLRHLPAGDSTISLPVPECGTGNAWIRVSLVRPQPLAGAAPAMMAEGAIPLPLDMSAYRQTLELDAPEKTEPAQTVTLQLRGEPGAEVTVAGVDEGILQLTRFITPDPFAFFAGSRRYAIAQWDIFDRLLPESAERLRAGDPETGGDLAMLMSNRLNPIDAKRFKPLAWWSGTRRFPDSGELELAVELPEFTGRIRWMAAQVGADGFGQAEAFSRVARPVVAQQSLPLFLAPGDRTEWILRLHNQSDREQRITVRPRVGGPLTADPDEESLTLRPGEARLLRRELQARNATGVGTAELTFVQPDRTWSDRIELAIRPPEAFRTETRFRVLQPGATIDLEPWQEAFPETAARSLRVSAFPTLQLAGAVDYLMQYPYGCLEQIVSVAFPLLLVPELAEDLARGADEMAQSAIWRIWRLQRGDGAFSYWSGDRLAQAEAGLYAMEFLLEAQSRGLAVDEQRLAAGLAWVRRLLDRQTWSSLDHSDYRNLVHATLILAKAGELERGWGQRLRERHDDLTGSVRILAAETLIELGERPAAAEMLHGLTVDRREPRLWFTNASENASLLRTLLRLDPTDSRIPELAERVMAGQKRGRWAHTYENAAVIRALAAYAAIFAESEPEPPQARWTATDQALAPDQSLPLAADFAGRLRNYGTRPLYLRETRGGIPRAAPEVRNAFDLQSRLLATDGQPIEGAVQSGRTMILHLRLSKLPGQLSHLILDQRLPAGLEPLPLQVQREIGRHTSYRPLSQAAKPRHLEIRDDRLLIFPDTLRRLDADFYLLVRAVSPGHYTMPAPYAQAMYDESVEARGQAGTLQVTRQAP